MKRWDLLNCWCHRWAARLWSTNVSCLCMLCLYVADRKELGSFKCCTCLCVGVKCSYLLLNQKAELVCLFAEDSNPLSLPTCAMSNSWALKNQAGWKKSTECLSWQYWCPEPQKNLQCQLFSAVKWKIVWKHCCGQARIFLVRRNALKEAASMGYLDWVDFVFVL